MAQYNLSKIFTDIQDSGFVNLAKDYLISDPTKEILSYIIKPELLELVAPSQLATFKKLENALGVVLDNYGIASFYAGSKVFKGHSPGFIGIQKADAETDTPAQMGLLLGSRLSDEDSKFQTSFVFFPIEVEHKEIPLGKRKIMGYEYTINGFPLELKEILDQQGKVVSYQLSLEVIDDEGNRDSFVIPSMVTKEVKDNKTLQSLFNQGSLFNALKEFGSGNGGVFFKASEVFRKAFQNKTFPSGGVFFLVKKGAWSYIPMSKYNTTSDILSSQWDIVGSSHPDFDCQYTIKDKETKEVTWMDSKLSDGKSIQFSSAAQNNESFNFFLKELVQPLLTESYEDDGSRKSVYSGYALIHIVAPNSRNLEHNPFNTLSIAEGDILEKLNWFKQTELKNLYLSLINKEERPLVSRSVLNLTQAKADLETAPISWSNSGTTGGKSDRPDVDLDRF